MSRVQVQSGIEFSIAGRQSRAAEFNERTSVVAFFGEETKPLKHGAVAKLIAVLDELLIVAV